MTTRGYDGEVYMGYPEVAPPPRQSYPPTALPLSSLEYSNDSSPDISNSRCLKFLNYFLATVFLGLILFASYKLIISNDTSFKLESISVALDKSDLSYNQSEAIRAAWDIGFSIKNPGSGSSASVRCLSSNWSAGLVQDTRYTTSNVHTVVITSFPREFVLPDHDQLKMRGLTLRYDVLIQTSISGSSLMVTGMCKNMSIVIPPNETQGLMVGGPRSCH